MAGNSHSRDDFKCMSNKYQLYIEFLPNDVTDHVYFVILYNLNGNNLQNLNQMLNSSILNAFPIIWNVRRKLELENASYTQTNSATVFVLCAFFPEFNSLFMSLASLAFGNSILRTEDGQSIHFNLNYIS